MVRLCAVSLQAVLQGIIWTTRKRSSFNCPNHSEVVRVFPLYDRCCAVIGLHRPDPGFLAQGLKSLFIILPLTWLPLTMWRTEYFAVCSFPVSWAWGGTCVSEVMYEQQVSPKSHPSGVCIRSGFRNDWWTCLLNECLAQWKAICHWHRFLLRSLTAPMRAVSEGNGEMGKKQTKRRERPTTKAFFPARYQRM